MWTTYFRIDCQKYKNLFCSPSVFILTLNFWLIFSIRWDFSYELLNYFYWFWRFLLNCVSVSSDVWTSPGCLLLPCFCSGLRGRSPNFLNVPLLFTGAFGFQEGRCQMSNRASVVKWRQLSWLAAGQEDRKLGHEGRRPLIRGDPSLQCDRYFRFDCRSIETWRGGSRSMKVLKVTKNMLNLFHNKQEAGGRRRAQVQYISSSQVQGLHHTSHRAVALNHLITWLEEHVFPDGDSNVKEPADSSFRILRPVPEHLMSSFMEGLFSSCVRRRRS